MGHQVEIGAVRGDARGGVRQAPRCARIAIQRGGEAIEALAQSVPRPRILECVGRAAEQVRDAHPVAQR